MQKEALPKIKGYIGRKVLKNNNQKFCDIVMWENMIDAKNALKTIMKDNLCLSMFEFINNNSVNMKHFNILSSSHNDLSFKASALEIGFTELINQNTISEVINNAENVRKNYLENQSKFISQFIIQENNGKYGEIVFNKKDTQEAEKICNGYFKNEICKKYISYFNSEKTNLQYWTVL